MDATAKGMIINQPFSIGDIIFLEPMYRYLWYRDGVKPTVPVNDHLIWLADYIESANIIKRSGLNQDIFEYHPISIEACKIRNAGSIEVFPARFANQIYRGYQPHDHHDFENMMLDKYRLAGIYPGLWDRMNLKLDERKCQDLMDMLIPSDWDDYVLVNENSQAGHVEINPKTDLRVIKMREIPGYSVLDWAYVMEFAQEQHHVSTCTYHILQALTVKGVKLGKIVIYPRPNEDGLRGIAKLKPSFNFEVCQSVEK